MNEERTLIRLADKDFKVITRNLREKFRHEQLVDGQSTLKKKHTEIIV